MNSRERVISTLCLETPDKVPYMEGISDPHIRKEILGRPIYGSARHMKSSDMYKDAHGLYLKNFDQEFEIRKKLKMDLIGVSCLQTVPKGYKHPFIGEDLFQDYIGRIYKQWSKDGTGTMVGRWYHSGILAGASPEEIENYQYPDLDGPDQFDLINKAIDTAGDEMFILGYTHLGWSYTWELLGGLDKALWLHHTHPDMMRRMHQKENKWAIEWAKIALDLGVDGIMTTDDLAETKGPMISPKMFKEIIVPGLRDLANTVHKRGRFLITHTDGNMYPILEYMIDAGIDCFHPVQPDVMDLKTCKEKYGDRIALSGNVSCATTLLNGTPEDTAKEVKSCIEAAASGGGYILSSSNSIYPGIKVENIWAMVEAKEKYGRYPKLTKE